MNVDLAQTLETGRDRVNAALDRLLPPESGPAATVARAMRYAVFGGGKRLRPILTLAAAEACRGDLDSALDPAAAIEMIHTYSLVHDDLPAMDDDDLRRGRPTVHRAFGEAEAILAGDGLLTLAFAVLASSPPGERFAARRAEAVGVAARDAGVTGMVGGQIADIEGERTAVDASGLEWIHRHKTGALLATSAEIGGIVAGTGETERAALHGFGMALGLAFQIADDVLDVTATAETIGKTPGKDTRAGKATYPALFGVDGSRERAASLVDDALRDLTAAGLVTPVLQSLARYAIDRRS